MTMIARSYALFVLLSVTACAAPKSAILPLAGGAPVLRPCPDWSRGSREDFSNRTGSNFGCADTVNFHAQLVDPQDAVRGKGGSPGDAAAAAAAIDRLRTRPAPMPPGGASAATPGANPESGA